ncbi:MAG: enhanced serine sensitivity protein SseB C-terminal domain-containing protein [Parvibaculaceae bacterium]|nr:enhanced serine sensitivity protein SseB C-terminal domain-containing protein [Parvibaculaceae bacterium]
MRAPEKTVVKKLLFLGEQDGRPERMLKEKLSKLFNFGGEIESAYLAQVDFGNGIDASVALCLRVQGNVQEKIISYVGAAFSNIFKTDQHLDIIFLNDDQELQLKRVCRPFFCK